MDYRVERGLQPRTDLLKIKAKVLAINAVEDVANPPELGTIERAMKTIRYDRLVLILYSDKTQRHFTHYYAAEALSDQLYGVARAGRGGSVICVPPIGASVISLEHENAAN